MSVEIPHVESLRHHSRRAHEAIVSAEREAAARAREKHARAAATFVEENLASLAVDLAGAADAGRFTYSRSWNVSHVPEGAVHEIAARLRARGYEAEVSREWEDYGDSAAPCPVDLLELTVRW